MSETKLIDIKELKFDEHNFNKHNDEGMSLLEKSIKENGLGRSILLDKDNNIVGGNGVTEKAIELGKTKVRIIETDGTELIAVKRTDLTLDSEQGRKMALADNSVAHANLEWNEDELKAAQEQWGVVPEEWGVELKDFGLPEDLPQVTFPTNKNAGEDVNPDDYGEEFNLPNEGKAQFGTMTFVVTDEQRDFINYCIGIAQGCEGFTDDIDNKNANGAALYLIAKEWVPKQALVEKSFEEIEQEYIGLRLYMAGALEASGKRAVDVDNFLGTNGMAGHYFHESQWMLPTREAYEKLKAILPLDRDYLECKIIERMYLRAIKEQENNGTL